MRSPIDCLSPFAPAGQALANPGKLRRRLLAPFCRVAADVRRLALPNAAGRRLPVSLRRPARAVAAGLAALCLWSAPVFGQANPKVSAQVWLGVNAQIRAASQYAIRVWPSRLGEPDVFYAWFNNYAGLETPVYSPNKLLQITPGRLYHMYVSCGSWHFADVHFNVPAGYTLYLGQPFLERTPRNFFRTDEYQGSYGTYSMDFELRPNDGSGGLAPGASLPPRIGDVLWSVSAGQQADGTSAGVIRWRTTTVSEALLDALSLDYADPGTDEVFVYRYADDALKYVGTDQVQLYVRRRPGAGYVIEAYNPWVTYSYPNNDPTQDWTFGEAAFATYDVHNPDATWQGRVQITRQADGRTDTWTLSVSGATTLLEQTNALQKIRLVSTPNTPQAGQRTEVATIEESGGVVKAKTTRIYQSFVWGEELLSETANPDAVNGPALTTAYAYYDTGWATSGNVTKLKSVKHPGGAWERYEYYEDAGRWGQPAAVYRRWQGGPATPGPDDPASATLTNCQVTLLDYVAEFANSGVRNLLSTTETRTLGVTTANSAVTPTGIWNNSAYNVYPNQIQQIRDETVQAYASAASALTTTRRVFHHTAVADYNGKLYAQTNPDGTKVAATYVRGAFSDHLDANTATWDSTDFTPDANGLYWCESFFYGASTAVSGSEPVTSFQGKPVDTVYLVPGKSVRRQVIRRNDHGLVAELTYVYLGGGSYKLIRWQKNTYTRGLLTAVDQSDGSHQSFAYTAGRLSYETRADGTQTQYYFDAIMRPVRREDKAAGASGSYPAQDAVNTYYTYDAAGNVTQTQTTGGSLTLTTTSVFNLAGLPTSTTDASGLVTAFAYANGGRTVTATLPGGATRVTDRYLDGSPKSESGTAIAGSFARRSVIASGGESGYQVAITYAVQDGNPRYSQAVTDWLGRTVREESPKPGGGLFQQGFAYNAAGQRTAQWETGKASTLFTYNALGELESTGLDVGQNGALDFASMDRIGKVQIAVVQLDGVWWKQTLNYAYNQANNATPLLQSETRERLVPYGGTNFTNQAFAETRAYDLFRNLTIQRTVIDRPNRLVTVTTDLPDSSADAVSTTYNGRLVRRQTAQNLVFDYRYDSLGRPIQTIDPRIGATTTAYHTSGTGANGQVASVQDPAGNTTSYGYSTSDGRLTTQTNALSKAVYYAYTARGELYRQWGAADYPVEYGYNSYGEKTAMSTYRGGGPWNQASWPASPGTADTTAWAYDAATGLLLNKTDAAGRVVTYTYNARGQLATRAWARGVVTTYAYNSATAEQTGITYSDGTPNLTYTYNRLGQTATVTDTTGTRSFNYSATTTQLQSEALPAYFGSRVLTRKYDTAAGAIGRNQGFTLSGAGGSGTDDDIGYGYDGYGRFNSLSLSPSLSFTYAYTANSNLVATVSETGGWSETMTYVSNRNLLSSVNGRFGAAVKARFDYTYDALGWRVTALKSGEEFSRYVGAGLHEAYAYNDRGELTGAQTYHNQNLSDTTQPVTGRQYAYGFDHIGNRASSSVDGRGVTYTANNLNQYTQRTTPGYLDVAGLAPSNATVTVNSQSPTRQGDYYFKSFTFGTMPLWQSFAISSNLGGSETRYGFLAANPEVYTYDLDGNVTADGRWSYTWDAENRLVSMVATPAAYGAGAPRQLLNFVYDYLGRRVRKTVSNWNGSSYVAATDTAFVYDGWNLAAEYLISGSTLTLTRSYVWGLDLSGTMTDGGGVGGLLAIRDASTGAFHLPAYDGNGNIAGLVNRASGILTAGYEYSPFGETIRSTGTYATANPFRFSSRYTDSETSLVYYGYRYYSPSLGRWLGRDPIGEKGGLHLYAFCGNNAINRWDYLGQLAWGATAEGISRMDAIMWQMRDGKGANPFQAYYADSANQFYGMIGYRSGIDARLDAAAANRSAAQQWAEGYVAAGFASMGSQLTDSINSFGSASVSSLNSSFAGSMGDSALASLGAANFARIGASNDAFSARLASSISPPAGSVTYGEYGSAPGGGDAIASTGGGLVDYGPALAAVNSQINALNNGAGNPGVYQPPGILSSIVQGITGAPQYWQSAIVDPNAPGSTIIAGIEGAGSGIYSTENPHGVGAMTLGTGQLVLAIGVTAKGALTGNEALIVVGVGMYGAGTTNLVGGAVYGPKFQGPLSPNTNVKDWTDWIFGPGG
ncbi:MAG: hypothetical protein PHE83_09255 [Opitutaceae bacterium]|nr:hypothetical protein [Opitutaceae bacterium]